MSSQRLRSRYAAPARAHFQTSPTKKSRISGTGNPNCQINFRRSKGTVANRLQSFGARLIGVNRRGAATPGVEQVFGYGDLLTALDHADAVVSSLPATPATHHLLDGLALDRLRPGAIVVNVGRGSVIDEAALIERLTDGRIGFAALDVFETEPLPASSPLWSLDNVIVSPHSAALSDKEEHRIAELFADNAGRLLDGRPLRSRMDVDEFY